MWGGADARLKHDYPGAAALGIEFDVNAATKNKVRLALGRGARYTDAEYDVDLRVLEESLVYLHDKHNQSEFESFTGDHYDDQGASDLDESALEGTSVGFAGGQAAKALAVRNAGAIRFYSQDLVGNAGVTHDEIRKYAGGVSLLKEFS